MARMPDIEAEAWQAVRRAEHAITSIWQHDTQAPAAQPVNITPATEGTDMSLATDAETWYAEAKAKFAEAEARLPQLIADAKKLDGNPLAQVALQAAEHLAAGILPPEALAMIAGNAGKLLGDVVSLYNPQGGTSPAQQQPAA